MPKQHLSRFAHLGRFLVTQSSGPLALRVGLPLYSAIGIAATIIFSSSGLDASTVVRRAESSTAARAILLAVWSVTTLPVIRAIISNENNLFLRALPLARWQLLGWLGALLLLAETPWIILWTRGGGVMSGVGATCIALALHACLAARVLTAADAVMLALACAAWLTPLQFVQGGGVQGGASATSIARMVVGAATFGVALGRAWQRVPEPRTSTITPGLGGSASSALAVAYVLVLVRRHRAALLRAALIVVIGIGWTALAVHNSRTALTAKQYALRLALSGWIPSCILAVATPIGPILRAESAAEWMLAVCGTTIVQRRAATMGLVASAGAAVGVLAGASFGMALDVTWSFRGILLSSFAASGALLSAATEVCFRWTIRDEGRDAGRLLLALAALIGAAEGMLWLTAG